MRTDILLSFLIALMVAVAAATGIFYTTAGPRIEHVTVRGEHATFQGSGLYRYDPAAVAREGTVWDVINLVVGVPLLMVAAVMTRRGSLRGRLILTGLAAYFFYVYLQYATMLTLNPLFLVYVAIFALSAVLFCVSLARIDVARLPEHITARFPRRLFIGFSFVLSGALVFLWTSRVMSIMQAGRYPDAIAGMTALVSQAVDLGMVVPLAIGAGVLLLRRSPWGYLLAAVVLIFGLMMFITIPSWIVVPLVQDGAIDTVEALPFILLSLFGIWLTWTFLRSVREA